MALLPPAPASLPTAYLTDERLAMRDAVRSFAMNVVLPVANELDPQHGLIPEHVVSTMAEMGLFGILVPEQYGGLGLGLVEYCMVTEELARAWMSVASIIARGNGLSAGFSAEQREAILPRVARGEYLGAFALANRTPDPTSRRYEPAPSATATSGSSPGRRCGARTPIRPTT